MEVKGKRVRIGLRKKRHSNLKVVVGVALILWAIFLSLHLALYVSERLKLESSYAHILVVDKPEELLEYTGRKGVVLLYFSQEFCPGCKKVEPAVLKLATEKTGVLVVKVDITQMLEDSASKTLQVLSMFRVTGTPTFILLKDGELVARHTSTFGVGDQYKYLVEFVEKGLRGEWEGVARGYGGFTSLPREVASTMTPKALLGATLQGYVLGLLAAFSPCSLPLLAAYAAMDSRRGRGFDAKSIAYKWLTLFSVILLAGSILVLAYVAGAKLPIVNIYGLAVSLLATVLVSWGLVTLKRKELVLLDLPVAEKLIPLLGLQCSLPFLMVLLAIIPHAPHTVVLAGFSFSLGYTLPYIALGSSGQFLQKIVRASSSTITVYMQALALIAAGLYTLYNIEEVFKPP